MIKTETYTSERIGFTFPEAVKKMKSLDFNITDDYVEVSIGTNIYASKDSTNPMDTSNEFYKISSIDFNEIMTLLNTIKP